ncbi:MAG TPA: zf-HC2 domain-containing protein [Candidatus Limnocylindria bacterium]|nr:zf-HC2 domain-containing protein [Candidatus Limnocylindria bacterium]
MTCGDVETLLDAFLDSELPPPMLVAVARHAAGCQACDQTIRSLTALREAVADTVRRDAERVDLSGLWPRIEVAIEATDRRRRWKERLRGAPLWAAGVAAAAGLALAVMNFQTTTPSATVQVQRRGLPRNHAWIDRIAGRDVMLRRLPKDGTTVIFVNYAENDY